jgi:hypothetical protein
VVHNAHSHWHHNWKLQIALYTWKFWCMSRMRKKAKKKSNPGGSRPPPRPAATRPLPLRPAPQPGDCVDDTERAGGGRWRAGWRRQGGVTSSSREQAAAFVQDGTIGSQNIVWHLNVLRFSDRDGSQGGPPGTPIMPGKWAGVVVCSPHTAHARHSARCGPGGRAGKVSR